MGGYQTSFTNPESSPNMTPAGKDLNGTTDLMLVIQSVTNQSHNLGRVSAEVAQLKDVVTNYGSDLREVRDKSIRVELQLSQIDKTLTQLNSQIEKGFADLAKSVEKSSAQQTESFDLKLAPINQFAQQTSSEVKEVKGFVEDLKRFRWALGGALVLLPVLMTIITTVVMRLITKT